MNMQSIAVIIPIRLASTRLPNKVVADIGGKPMLYWVAKQAVEADIGDVYVACCSDYLADIARSFGYNAIVTDPNLASGTDRVHAASEVLKKEYGKNYDIITNVQGDMPFVEPSTIVQAVDVMRNAKSDIDMATVICTISEKNDISNPSVVKAIIAEPSKRALYFTRSASPFDYTETTTMYKHIGIYVYKESSLNQFIKLPQSKLEIAERLEQLRALEHGMQISTGIVDDFPISVDTGEDLEKAREHFIRNIRMV